MELYFVGPAPVGNLISVPIQTSPNFLSGRPEALFSIPALGFQINNDLTFSPLYDIIPNAERFVFVQPAVQADSENAPPPQINIVQNWFEELKERVPVL